jgi:predicted DCC family thiol-disulfide oxidoreductase YuxK
MNASNYPMTLFFDGLCPLCVREMGALRRRDRTARLRFVDVRAPGFVVPFGATLDDMLAAIHACTAQGRLVAGVETVRLAYEAVGLGWLLAPTAWRPLRGVSERAYAWLARHRFAVPAWLALAALGRRDREALCDDSHCAL